MTRGVVTNNGFNQSSNSYSRSEFGFKFKIIGARTAPGDTLNPVYSQPTEDLMKQKMRELLTFTSADSTVFKGKNGTYIPLTAATPVQGTSTNPIYSMVFEFQINPDDILTVTTPFNIREIGLYAQMFVEASQWTYAESYTAGTSYVFFGDKFYVAAANFTAIPEWSSTLAYTLNTLVHLIDDGKFYNCIQATTPGISPPNGSYWSLIPADTIQPGTPNPGWAIYAPPGIDPKKSLLIPYGEPYLYQIEIRDVPIQQNSEHTTRWVTTVEFAEATSTVIFGGFTQTDILSFTEMQLAFIETVTTQNREIRDLAVQVDVNTTDIQTINTLLNIP